MKLCPSRSQTERRLQVGVFRAAAAEATQLPYLVIAAAVALMAAAVHQTRFPAYHPGGHAAAGGAGGGAGEQLGRWAATARQLLGVRRFRHGAIPTNCVCWNPTLESNMIPTNQRVH